MKLGRHERAAHFSEANVVELRPGDACVVFRAEGDMVDVVAFESGEKIGMESPLYQVARVRCLYAATPEADALRSRLDDMVRSMLGPPMQEH